MFTLVSKIKPRQKPTKYGTIIAQLMPAKCTWASTVSKACKTDLSTANPQDRQCHLYKHSLGGNGQTYKCYWDGCKESFTTREKLTQHAYYTHGWILWTSSIRVYFWCEKAIFEIKSTKRRLSHFESHHDEAIQTVRDYGYSGVFIGQNRYSNRATQFLPLIVLSVSIMRA
jgi:hypothetical protein